MSFDPGGLTAFCLLHGPGNIFHAPAFQEMGLCTEFPEEYYSVSRRRVLRGLHFQEPPHAHVKIVCCVLGRVMDAVLDLRKESPAFGEHRVFELESESPDLLYIPEGVAHGFYVLSDVAVMVYRVSTVYCSEHDKGVLWNSAGISWPDTRPILSRRDAALPPWRGFKRRDVF